MRVWGGRRPGVVRCGSLMLAIGVVGVAVCTLWRACNALDMLFYFRVVYPLPPGLLASWPVGLWAAGTACGRSRVGPAWPRL